MSFKKNTVKFSGGKLDFAGTEAVKRLRANLITAMSDCSGCRVVGVTSAQPQEGKTTVALNLASSFAELGKRVLIIEADMRHPAIAKTLSLPCAPGLSNILTDASDVSAVQKSVGNALGAKFDALTCGEAAANPSELLHSESMKKLLIELRSAYDYIIVDFPALGDVIDAAVLAPQLDGMLVVAREGVCCRDTLAECVEQLKLSDAKILGFVVNAAERK